MPSEEQMYCSQQICIPPMYPYVLRQFAKAAIRSQPADLLRWATAYFRCLSLNLPPPIKPRLEYPIPKDYCGVTPGWLKALLYQLHGNINIGFKVLWDRWLGACLQHKTLVLILCLGGFKDPNLIPIYRFIGLCASFLTESLTQTMTLVCEILTEEPEGGSAMIPVETFNDIYQFLANIDGSKPQILYNLYFRDSLLGIYEEPPPPPPPVVEEEEPPPPEEEAEAEEEAPPEEEEEAPLDDGVYSCPDIAVDKGIVVMPEDDIAIGLADIVEPTDDLFDDDFQPDTTGPDDDEPQSQTEEEEKEQTIVEEEICAETRQGSWVSKETVTDDEIKPYDYGMDHDKFVYIDLGMMQGGGEEEMSVDYSEKAKELAAEEEELEAKDKQKFGMAPSDFDLDALLAGDDEAGGKPEPIYCEAIPGIGGIVPEDMVKAVVNYMLEMGKEQHGVVMPRNVKHYNCPPLELRI